MNRLQELLKKKKKVVTAVVAFLAAVTVVAEAFAWHRQVTMWQNLYMQEMKKQEQTLLAPLDFMLALHPMTDKEQTKL